jgi:hypothetical protein
MRLRRKQRIQRIQRCWFRDEDGTYFRNRPLIMAEIHALAEIHAHQPASWGKRDIRKINTLLAEKDIVWQQGVIRKPALDPDDCVVRPASFRETYPGKPGLWALDFV